MKNKFIYTVGTIVALFSVSCDSFLEELPDNRTTLSDKEKIQKILVSAYPESSYALVAEMSSDNVDDTGEYNPNTTRFYDQVAYWKQITEVNNDDLKSTWSACYLAIANANEALRAIEKLGNSPELNPLKGEALVARAYAHFVLVNLFSNHYNKQTSATDLGITYMLEPETKLNPKYQRGNVKEVYEKIEKDLKEGIHLIDDSIYEVPKYHFNKDAAHAFAARFYLFYEKWDEAIKYASLVLKNDPSLVIRDWKQIADLPQKESVLRTEYIQAKDRANLLLQTDASSIGLVFGPYYSGSRYSHWSNLAERETISAEGPWGATGTNTFWQRPFEYSATNLDKSLLIKMAYIFQYTDLVAQTGYARTIYTTFTTDEALLIRAEAYILKGEYDKAEADLKVWSKAYLRSGQEVSRAEIEAFYSAMPYSTDDEPNQKKKLNPKFAIQAGTQENMLHCVLHYRRILTLHEGLRWFDIRRYGIEVPRYLFRAGGKVVADKLKVDDLRRTFQIPQDVIDAGLTPNPR